MTIGRLVHINDTMWDYNIHKPYLVRDDFQRRFLIIAGPSGAGKTTITNHICSLSKEFGAVRNTTTRERRESDPPGHFSYVDEHEFQRLLSEQSFLFCRVRPDPKYGYRDADVQQGLTQHSRLIFMFRTSGVLFFLETMPVTPIVLISPNPNKLGTYRNDPSRGVPTDQVEYSEFVRRTVPALRARKFPILVLENNYEGTHEIDSICHEIMKFSSDGDRF